MRINCRVPIVVRVIGEPTRTQLDALGDTLARAVAKQLAKAEQVLAERHRDETRVTPPVRERYEPGRAAVPSYASDGQSPPRSTPVLAPRSAAGNRAVGAPLPGHAVGAAPRPVSKEEVPGLPADVLVRVESHLATGSASGAQAAIDLVVEALAARGDINLALIKGRRMRFDPTLTDEGHTQQWGRPASGGGFHPLPSTVRIGPRALTNASWLYATIIHEYRHAEMFQTARSDPFKEVDAYLYNIERADEAGLDGGEVLEIWGRVRDEWADVPDSLKPLYQERYDAAETTVRRITGTTSPAAPAAIRPVQRGRANGAPSTTTPGPAPTAYSAAPARSQAVTCGIHQTLLVYAGSPGTDRCISEDDPEFRANYIDNNIVLATGLCLPGTSLANIDHARVPQIQLTYRDGRQLTIEAADVPLLPASAVRRRAPVIGGLRPLARYEKRGDGFIYPIREANSAYISYLDAANILSLRAGLHETIEELKRLFTLMELSSFFAGLIASLGGMASLNAANKNGLFQFVPRAAKGQGKVPAAPPKPTRDPAAAPRPAPARQDSESPKSTSTRGVKPGSTPRPDDEPAPKTPKVKQSRPKAGKGTEERPDRELTSGKSDKPAAKKKAPGGGEGEEQTAAERDWEHAAAEAKRQNDEAEATRLEAEARESTRTEHGAIREGQRGALTPSELGRLGAAVRHRQGDGSTARVIRQRGGTYLVHITNKQDETVTIMRDMSSDDVIGRSRNYLWHPPWSR